jgi:hypothetical protein
MSSPPAHADLTSDVEPQSPELRQEVLLDYLAQVLETWSASLELPPGTSVIASAQHAHAFSYSGHRRFYFTARGERRPQFLYRAADVSVGIRPQLSGELRDPRERDVELIQLSVQGSPPIRGIPGVWCCAPALERRGGNTACDRQRGDVMPQRVATGGAAGEGCFQTISMAAGPASPTSSRSTAIATDGGDHSNASNPKTTSQRGVMAVRLN